MHQSKDNSDCNKDGWNSASVTESVNPCASYEVFANDLTVYFRNMINSGSLWSTYKINKSPADGHCMLHSLVTCLNEQLIPYYDRNLLIHKVSEECCANTSRYMPKYIGSASQFHHEMKNYMQHRLYKSQFCDLLPRIAANALVKTIVILDRLTNKYQVYVFTPCVNDCVSEISNEFVVLHRTVNHYDACISTLSDTHATHVTPRHCYRDKIAIDAVEDNLLSVDYNGNGQQGPTCLTCDNENNLCLCVTIDRNAEMPCASNRFSTHYGDVVMGAMASLITSLTIVYSIVYSGRSKKTSKLHVTGLCVGNSPGTGEFPAQMASYAENVSI